MINRPDPGRYVHYKKGDEYTVIDVVRHSETQEWLVLYRAEYGVKDLWVRPIGMFIESVNVNGEWVKRFKPKSESV